MDPTARSVVRWTLVALAVTFSVLLASGLWLIWNYVPADAALWSSVRHVESSVEWVGRVRWVHHWTSQLTVVLAIAVLVETAIGSAMARRWRPALVGLSAPLVALVASFTGHLIAWDQLALWAVTIGENLTGYRIVYDGQFRFAILGGRRIGAGTFRIWFWTHVAVIPVVALTGLMLAIVVLSRRRPAAIASPAVPDVDVIRE